MPVAGLPFSRPNSHTPGGRRSPRGLGFVVLVAIFFYAAPAVGDMFTYVRFGNVDLHIFSPTNPFNLALNLGYELDSDIADFSIMAEVSRTVNPGDSGAGENLEFESNGIYLVQKSTRSLFASYRIGLVENKIISGSDSDRSSGLAYGAGIGVVIGRTRLQIEFTFFADNAKQLTLGLQF